MHAEDIGVGLLGGIFDRGLADANIEAVLADALAMTQEAVGSEADETEPMFSHPLGDNMKIVQ